MTALHMPETKLDFRPNLPEALDHSLAEARSPTYRQTEFRSQPQHLSSSNLNTEFNLDSIPRSASYTQLPATTGPDASFERNGVKRTFSENLIANPKANNFRHASIKKRSKRVNDPDQQQGHDEVQRTLSDYTKSGPTITISGFQIGAEEDETETAYQPTSESNSYTAGSEPKPRSVSGSLARLKRQSWIVSSRSPSPSRRKSLVQRPTTADGNNKSRPSGIAPTVSDGVSTSSRQPNADIPGRSKNDDIQRKRSRRRISSYLSMSSMSDANLKDSTIPRSISSDRLPLSHAHTSSEKPPRIPSSKSFERLSALGTESPRRKDDLWSAFRNLDADFQKFQSRSSTMKCAVVRTTLLPFLKSHMEILPNFSLRPEDLDRRVNVLNRWWTGLLEMINGRNGESVSGSDRPTILEAITAIMVRPEWSVSPSTSPARPPKPSLKSRSTTSLRSTTSDFLTESVIHNIRNTYVQNLLAQMAFVVDKLSIRSVPASVVAFCGKATAYAFFYCDGVAEILVRLWSLSPDLLRRVHEASGVSRASDIGSISEGISMRFPTCVQKLAFSNTRSMMRYLRNRPHVPIATTYIPWEGPWTGRWAGRDTDLFYLFTKQYCDLLSQHLPEDYSKEEALCAPGYALLQAQILSLLDSTLLRTNSQPLAESLKGPSFDDVLAEADASAAVLPISPHTMARSMAENRLIMLLRDCLSANATIAPRAKTMFAEAFQRLMKAAASRTSQFDHLACFTLCDFLEEAIFILIRFHQSCDSALGTFDWLFWIRVLKLMMESNNSMTEIRLCTLLYSLWNTINGDEQRRKDICLGWLLSEDTFSRQFNHWCPMVRAYYMRLLIWRVGRLDGNASEVDSQILRTLSHRLQTVWRTYLYVKDEAENNGSIPPTTAPCSPAPSRCLLIIRNEAPAPPMFLSFESMLQDSQPNGSSKASHRNSTLFSPPPPPARKSNDNEKPSSAGKKRWGLLRTILPFTSSPSRQGVSKPTTTSTPSAVEVGKVSPSLAGSDTSASRQSVLGADVRREATTASKPLQAITQYRTHSFKFSLEWLDRGQLPSRDKRLYPPRLPLQASQYFQSEKLEPLDHTPLKPQGAAINESRYAGRALAEWALLVAECYNFFERRKQEGVPANSKVETPTLSVEPFRKP